MLLAGLLLLAAAPVVSVAPAAAQDAPSRLLAVTTQGAVSLTSGFSGPRIAGDMVALDLRVMILREAGIQPWVGAAPFRRPGFECSSDFLCTRDGWSLLGGIQLPLSSDPASPGLHAAVLGGAGAVFAQDRSFSSVLGLAVHWRRLPRLSPTAEIRWEQVGGISLAMLAAGLRIDL